MAGLHPWDRDCLFELLRRFIGERRMEAVLIIELFEESANIASGVCQIAVGSARVLLALIDKKPGIVQDELGG